MWPKKRDRQLGLLQDLAVWVQSTALRGWQDPLEVSEPVLQGAGLGMPQNCIPCPILETTLERYEEGKVFIKFLIVWLKLMLCLQMVSLDAL